MIKLQNDKINITISEHGAEVIEGKKADGSHFIWMGDEASWSDHSPILFPICGKLLDDEFLFEGKKYNLPFHGFAKQSEFEVLEASEETALFSLKYNADTLKMYPFKFDFRVRYTLKDNTVEVIFETINLDDKPLFFSAGAHEGYYLEDGIENYYVEFDEPQTLHSCKITGKHINEYTEPVIENSKHLDFKTDKYWPYDIILRDIKFSAVTLYNSKGEKMIRAEFKGFPNLLFWSCPQPQSRFVCIEPWCGLPDFIGDNKNFEEKRGLIKVDAQKSYSLTHSYTVY